MKQQLLNPGSSSESSAQESVPGNRQSDKQHGKPEKNHIEGNKPTTQQAKLEKCHRHGVADTECYAG